MLQALKTIAEAEKESKRIIEAANAQAQEIKRKITEEAEKVYEETYRQVITAAKQRAAEAEKKAQDKAELETQAFLQQADEQLGSVRVKVRKNFDNAVEAALSEILT